MTAFDFAVLAITATAAVYDLRTGHIPNWLTLGSLSAAVVAHGVLGAFSGGGAGLARSVGEALWGVLICGAVPAIVFFRGGIGGGDVKLFGAIGAVCFARDGLLAESYSLIIALLLAPARLAYEGKLLRTVGNAVALVINPLRSPAKRRTIAPELMTWFRLAPAILLGTVTMLVLSR